MSKLLDNVRTVMRTRHYSYETEKRYIYWIRQFIFFHNVRHPAEMGAVEIEAFLSHLAVEKTVAASTQNQALAAIFYFFIVRFCRSSCRGSTNLRLPKSQVGFLWF